MTEEDIRTWIHALFEGQAEWMYLPNGREILVVEDQDGTQYAVRVDRIRT